MKNRTALCLLLCATLTVGCHSTPRLSSRDSKDLESSVKKVEQAESASKPPVSLASTRPQSLEGQIQAGQVEIANWYSDQQPHHLTAARTSFEEVLRQQPQDSQAHHGLAIVADLEKNFPLAEHHYQQALIQSQNNSDILGDLGFSYLLQNRLAESERYSMMALQANPGNQKAVKHLGDVYARQGKMQLAQETYARVLSPLDVQKALAENAPRQDQGRESTPVAQSSSLIDRMIPGRNTGGKLVEDIQKRQQEYRGEQARRLADQNSSLRSRSGFPDERVPPEALLRQQLAEIDQEAARQPPSGPILLDDQTRQLTRLPGGDSAATWSQGANQPMSTMMPMSEAPAYGSPSRTPNPLDGRSGPSLGAVSPNAHSPVHAPTESPYVRDPYESLPQHPGAEYSVAAGGLNPASSPTQLPGLQPWNGVPIPPQYNHREYGSPGNPVAVNHAYQQAASPSNIPEQIVPAMGQGRMSPDVAQQSEYNRGPAGEGLGYSVLPAGGQSPNLPPSHLPPPGQQQHFGGPATLGQPAGNSTGLPQQDFLPQGLSGTMNPQVQQPVNPGSPPGAADAYQEASRAAARMGMGLGPVGMYRQAPSQPPGSMSYEEMGVAPPQRAMPDDRPVQNLNQAYNPWAGQNIPPAVTQGGQMPSSTVPMHTRDQYNSPTRFEAQTMMNSNIPQSSWDAMKSYEAQRWQAGQQHNRAVQEVWAQGPVNSPLSPSAGSQYSYPNSTGPSYTPNPPPISPDQSRPPMWPNSPQAVSSPSVIAAQQANPQAPAHSWQQYLEQRQQQQQQQMLPPGQQQNWNAQQQPSQPQSFGKNVTIPPSYRPDPGSNAPSQPVVQPGLIIPAQATEPSRNEQFGDDQSQWPTIRPR